MNNQPIGVFDSGIGGITVLSALKQIMPRESYFYFGDTARVPYGSKSKEVVVEYSVQIASFLKSLAVKSIIIACNTSSAVASSVLEDILDIPVINVIEPTTRTALSTTKKGKIGVIGTRNTINSGAYEHEILKFNKDVLVYSVACPMFVPYIEENELTSSGLKSEIARCLDSLLKNQVDTIILGCTHYPIIRSNIQEFIGDDIHLVDSGISVASETQRILEGKDILTSADKGELEFYVTGGINDFSTHLLRFGLPSVHIKPVEILTLQQPLSINKATEYKSLGGPKL
jgi:glutamate racemase